MLNNVQRWPRTERPPTTENRWSIDFRAASAMFSSPATPIIDIHTHIHGETATRIYDEARRLYGVGMTYSMTQLPGAAIVRDRLGETVRFIAMPTWSEPDKAYAHGRGYLRTIEAFRKDYRSRMLKIWASPRLREIVPDADAGVRDIDSPQRIAACELGQSLGMMFMVHVADPDTWFATKYKDSAIFGTKRHQYVGLERMLDRFTAPWIAAHMGGWPEDLAFLDGLLTRHPNLHLDTSATRWVVRALGGHATEAVRAFFIKWKTRILFGSDIVAMEDHVSTTKSGMSPKGEQAASPEEAFDVYAGRYFALRLLLESGYEGESPIADPDLKMVEPDRYDSMSAPWLRGVALPIDVLEAIYVGNARRVVGGWEAAHPA
jgi:Amidohydrolase